VAGEGLKLELDGILLHAAGARFRSETRPPRTKSQKVALKVASREQDQGAAGWDECRVCVLVPRSQNKQHANLDAKVSPISHRTAVSQDQSPSTILCRRASECGEKTQR
jgi:hypothetical protein